MSDDSIAVDRGRTDYVDGFVVDLAGRSRIQGKTVDLGTYESNISPEFPSVVVTTVEDVVDPFLPRSMAAACDNAALDRLRIDQEDAADAEDG